MDEAYYKLINFFDTTNETKKKTLLVIYKIMNTKIHFTKLIYCNIDLFQLVTWLRNCKIVLINSKYYFIVIVMNKVHSNFVVSLQVAH